MRNRVKESGENPLKEEDRRGYTEGDGGMTLRRRCKKNGKSQRMMQRTGTTGQNPYMAPAPDTKEMATEDRRWWIQLSIVWTARHSDKDSPDCNRTASCPWPRRGSRGAGG